MHSVLKTYAPVTLFGVLCFSAGLIVSGQVGKVLAADNAPSDDASYTFGYDTTFDKKWPISTFRDKHNGATLYINQATGAIAVAK